MYTDQFLFILVQRTKWIKARTAAALGTIIPLGKLRNSGNRKHLIHRETEVRQVCNELPLHPPFRQNIPPWPCQCISAFLLDLEQPTNLPRSWLRHDYRGEGVLFARENDGVCRTREMHSLVGELVALRTRHLRFHQHPAPNRQRQGAAPSRSKREGVSTQLSMLRYPCWDIHPLRYPCWSIHGDWESVYAVSERGRCTWIHTAVSKGRLFCPEDQESYITPPYLTVQGSFMLSARLKLWLASGADF